MSLFIVNFHWQTYSYNISFQAQRLERLRKERQNQIKCKNVQWKDRNTSYSGKKKRFFIFLLFLLLMVTTFSVCDFHSRSQSVEELIPVLAFRPHSSLPGVSCRRRVFAAMTSAFRISNKGKVKKKGLNLVWSELIWLAALFFAT